MTKLLGMMAGLLGIALITSVVYDVASETENQLSPIATDTVDTTPYPLVPLTLEQYIAKEKATKFCSVHCCEGKWVDWVVPQLRSVETGEFYAAHLTGLEISVWLPDKRGECLCVPELTPKDHRVRGRVIMVSPNRIAIDQAIIEPVSDIPSDEHSILVPRGSEP
jgi:hypothetical protein